MNEGTLVKPFVFLFTSLPRLKIHLSSSHQFRRPHKQSTGICSHLITFSSRKYIILNKLSSFKSKHTFSEVREHIFCLKYRCQRVYVCRHFLFWQTPVSTPFIGCWRKRCFHCSPIFTGCTLYCTRNTKDYQQFITKI